MKKQIFAATKALLPLKVRNALFHFGFNIARKEFDKFAYQYAFAPNMRLALEAAKSRGLDAEIIVDVGAFEGNWSRMVNEIWPQSEITMIEANNEKAPILEPVARQLGARLEFALLGATSNQQVDFYVMESGSSVFEERSNFERRKIAKNMKTLDEVLKGTRPVDLLKLDTQGFELEILKGATNTLATTHAVLMEVSLIEINKGAPLLHDVVPFMKERGFVSYDIPEIHRRQLDGAMNQVDILFVREGSPLLAEKSFN